MIKPRRLSIREAPPKGPQFKAQTLPEQPVDPSGKPAALPPTYEQLAEYATVAFAKLKEFRALLEDVYGIVSESIEQYDAGDGTARETLEVAQTKLAAFNRHLPILGKLRPKPPKKTPPKPPKKEIQS